MLKKLISGLSCAAIVGTEKNTGKTTLLNRLLSITGQGSEPVGITSIGYDGEETDQVTKTPKPKIYIKRGTLAATASMLLNRCDFTKEILALSGINTSMGEVVLLRALSDGYIQIAGPSTTEQMELIVLKLKEYGAKKVFIDGALARKSTAAISASDGCFLATGAALSTNLEKLAAETAHCAMLLTLPKCKCEPSKLNKIFENDKNYSENSFAVCKKNFEPICFGSSLNEEDADLAVNQILNPNRKELKIVFSGAVTNGFIKRFLAKTRMLEGLKLIADDGTRFLTTALQLAELKRRGANLLVKNPVNLLGISLNPYSPQGLLLDVEAMRQSLGDELKANKIFIPIV